MESAGHAQDSAAGTASAFANRPNAWSTGAAKGASKRGRRDEPG